jgi:hypothetical protein
MIIAVAGQTVTVDGGAGFQNSDVHKSIRADLIKETAEGLAHTVNTQGIPAYVMYVFGEDAVDAKPCVVEWDVTPPKDRNSEATSMVTAGNAIKMLREALAPDGFPLDVSTLARQFAIPLLGDADGDGVISADEIEDVVPDVQPRQPLRLVSSNPEPDAEPVAPAAAVDAAPDADADKAADTALNGAQVASLLEVIDAVVSERLPRESAIAILEMAFNMSHDRAERVIGKVGQGFVPKSDAPAAPAPTPNAGSEVAA